MMRREKIIKHPNVANSKPNAFDEVGQSVVNNGVHDFAKKEK